MTFLFANNAQASLAAPITSLSNSIEVGLGEGAVFPNPSAGQKFRLTLQVGADVEIVEVTARSGDTMTIVRAREGTTARLWAAGANVQMRLTAGIMETFAPSTPSSAALAGLTPEADRLPYYTGAAAAALTLFTPFGRSLVGAANAAAGRTVLGLGDSGVAAGTYARATVTVDVLGRITAIAAGEAVPPPFPSGTRMLFQQTAAPTGWTKDTSLNDRALRVVSGSVVGGGSAAFSSVFASRTPTGAVGGHALTIAEMPSHTHDFIGPNDSGVHPTGSGRTDPTTTQTRTTGATGGGAAHSHGLTMNAMDFAVSYTDVIVATKD